MQISNEDIGAFTRPLYTEDGESKYGIASFERRS